MLSTLILFGCCNCKDSESSATDGRSNLTVIYRALKFTQDYGIEVKERCSGKDSDGYTHQPFFSFSTKNLKDRLPKNYWENPVQSEDGTIISSSWTG